MAPGPVALLWVARTDPVEIAGLRRSPPVPAQLRAADTVSPVRSLWTSRTVSAVSGWSLRQAGGAVACAGGLFTISRWPCGLCSAGPEAARPPVRRGPGAQRWWLCGPARCLPPGAGSRTWAFGARLTAREDARELQACALGPGLAAARCRETARRRQLPGGGPRGERGLSCRARAHRTGASAR